MADKRPSILVPVLIAGALTLAVTGVRLYGERQGWDPRYFSKDAGGGMALVGIAWLPVVFGLWFGRRLARAGRAPQAMGRAFLLQILALGAFVGGMGWLMGRMETMEPEAVREVGPYIGYTAMGLTLLALMAWPSAFVANLFYGVLARTPVIAAQYLSIHYAWDTHYSKVHPKLPPMTPDEKAYGLLMAQLTVWIPFTILVGGLFALIGAKLTRKKG